jgi:hypothetical protein
MSRLRFDKIPIWENERRIKDLTFWRDLWLEGTFQGVKLLVSPTTGKPFSSEERHAELNRRIPGVREMVKLAVIPTTRDWVTIRKDDPPVRVDILEQFWYVEKLRISFRAPSDVVDEAIGKYQSDQRRSWIRTFNPLYWFGRIVDRLLSEAFNVVTIFGGNPETARGSWIGRILFVIAQFGTWLLALAAAACTVLEFMGFKTPIRHFFHLPP